LKIIALALQGYGGHPTFANPAKAGIHLYGVDDGFPLSRE
jgi:hypothetical protein